MHVSKWITHVKQWSKKNGLKYGDALGNSNCKSEYHRKNKTGSSESSTMRKRGGKKNKSMKKDKKSRSKR